ncbi:MAG: large subunit ribosomal protein [Patescibacteria group bacterium]|nr:large subunit ribosomal protein [Patescibacteria group bacterium]
MAKQITANLKMRIPAGGATAGPPVGAVMGQYGLNSMDFVNAFNSQTADLRGNDVIVKLKVYDDRTFDFVVSGVPTDDLILKALGIKKGSGKPHMDKVGKLTQAQLTDIAEAKIKFTNGNDIEAVKKQVAGTARSMGVEVEE